MSSGWHGGAWQSGADQVIEGEVLLLGAARPGAAAGATRAVAPAGAGAAAARAGEPAAWPAAPEPNAGRGVLAAAGAWGLAVDPAIVAAAPASRAAPTAASGWGLVDDPAIVVVAPPTGRRGPPPAGPPDEDALASVLSGLSLGRGAGAGSNSTSISSTSTSSSSSRISSSATRVLLVLDMNGLLVSRVRRDQVNAELKAHVERPGGPVWGPGKKHLQFLRPHAAPFVNFLFAHFDVAVWSSAMRVNVESMVRQAMPAYEKRLAGIFDQDDCTTLGKHPHNLDKPLFIKELARVWAKLPQYAEGRTLLLDDSPYKAVANPPLTAIHPKEWEHTDAEDAALAPEGPLESFLRRLALAAQQPDFLGVPAFLARETFATGYTARETLEQENVAELARSRLINRARSSSVGPS